MSVRHVVFTAVLLVSPLSALAEKQGTPMPMHDRQGMMQQDGGMGDMMDMPMMREHMKDMQEHMQQMMSGDTDMEARMEQMQEHMQKMQRHMEMMQHMMEMMHGDSEMKRGGTGK